MAQSQDLENEEFCYICFEGPTRTDSGELEPLVKVCKCPTVVHRRCIARWQLYSAGKSEEKSCRFCKGALPDWKEILTPRSLPAAVPVLSIYYNQTSCRVKVRPGPDGLRAFLRQLEVIVGHDVAGVNFVFRCRCPDTGDEIFLQGLQAFEAAMHCACVRAAQRSLRQQHQQQQRQEQQQQQQQQQQLQAQQQQLLLLQQSLGQQQQVVLLPHRVGQQQQQQQQQVEADTATFRRQHQDLVPGDHHRQLLLPGTDLPYVSYEHDEALPSLPSWAPSAVATAAAAAVEPRPPRPARYASQQSSDRIFTTAATAAAATEAAADAAVPFQDGPTPSLWFSGAPGGGGNDTPLEPFQVESPYYARQQLLLAATAAVTARLSAPATISSGDVESPRRQRLGGHIAPVAAADDAATATAAAGSVAAATSRTVASAPAAAPSEHRRRALCAAAGAAAAAEEAAEEDDAGFTAAAGSVYRVLESPTPGVALAATAATAAACQAAVSVSPLPRAAAAASWASPPPPPYSLLAAWPRLALPQQRLQRPLMTASAPVAVPPVEHTSETLRTHCPSPYAPPPAVFVVGGGGGGGSGLGGSRPATSPVLPLRPSTPARCDGGGDGNAHQPCMFPPSTNPAAAAAAAPSPSAPSVRPEDQEGVRGSGRCVRPYSASDERAERQGAVVGGGAFAAGDAVFGRGGGGRSAGGGGGRKLPVAALAAFKSLKAALTRRFRRAAPVGA